MLITYSGLTVQVGISHQFSNLKAMLKEAHLCGRGLLLPEFQLAAHHNYGRLRRSTLAEYYEMESASVEGTRVPVFEPTPSNRIGAIIVRAEENLIGRQESLLCKDVSGIGLVRKPLELIYPGFPKLKASVGLRSELHSAAERAAPGIRPRSAWVHVRRGDRLDRTAEGTSPENIRRVITNVAPETQALYIATDEKDPEFFEPLKEYYDVATFRDFPEFVQLISEDNYRLFLVEQLFSRHFPVRISTFRAPGDWFHGALCEDPGWQ
jgi:hypothetical protein